jgi:hypothetical protein
MIHNYILGGMILGALAWFIQKTKNEVIDLKEIQNKQQINLDPISPLQLERLKTAPNKLNKKRVSANTSSLDPLKNTKNVTEALLRDYDMDKVEGIAKAKFTPKKEGDHYQSDYEEHDPVYRNM